MKCFSLYGSKHRENTDQRSQFENNNFSKKISMEVLGLCLPDVETYFEEQH